MTRKLTLTTIALLGTSMMTAPALADRLSNSERAEIQDRALANLRELGYRSSDFDRIVIRVDDDEIDVEALGRDVDVDLTYARDGRSFGRLIEGDVDDDIRDRDIVYTSAGWVDDDDDDDDDDDRWDDDDDDDEDDDDDDRRDDDDDDDDDDDRGRDNDNDDDDDDDDD